MKIKVMILVMVLSWSRVRAVCPPSALDSLQMVVEHGIWRGWQQARIFAPGVESGCNWALVRLSKCLAVNGVASTVGTINHLHLSAKAAIVILAPTFRGNATESLSALITKLKENEINSIAYDWLISSRSEKDISSINKILQSSLIRFDQNLFVTYSFRKSGEDIHPLDLCDNNFIYTKRNLNGNNLDQKGHDEKVPQQLNEDFKCRDSRNKSCLRSDYQNSQNYYRSSERFKNVTRHRTYKKSGNEQPLYQAGVINYNFSKAFQMTKISKFSLKRAVNNWYREKNYAKRLTNGVHVMQYFKVKRNSTLYVHFLGIWNHEYSMSMVEHPYPVEARNFLGEELAVGRCNATGDGLTAEDEGPTSPATLDDVLEFIDSRLHTNSQTRYYSKLGFRSYEGAWTGLLGGLMDYSVDVALEPVTAHPSQHHDMDFVFPIAKTMCNIYIRHQETSTVRDIFLAPFSPRLLASVLGMTIIIALAVVFITRVTPALRHEPRPMGYTEAFLWSTGILCQQGGSWTPPNPAASILLIACLSFAIVTYNAYAAFITSVLSVRVASLDTVAAVLDSPNFKIGYIKNGGDQMYLMSTKDAQLNEFYIRGYAEAQNLVSSAEEGLTRAAKEDYAFFASQRAARLTLSSLSQARGRCRVRELPVYSTRAYMAFPLPKRSPYARLILLSLLQLRSSGALARLEAALVPPMPQCSPPQGFASARAADVHSAIILLGTGFVAASFICLIEYSWKNRMNLGKNISRMSRRFTNFIISMPF